MAITKPEPHTTEFNRIPVEYLPEEIGSVSDSVLPPPADPFEGDDPFPMSPYRSLFTEGAEIAEALAKDGEVGETVWDFTGE